MQVTDNTKLLVDKWIMAKREVVRLKRQLNAAEVEAINAQNELGKWLVPPDQKACVPFNIWYGSGIIEATRDGLTGVHEVKWRKEPDGKDRHECGF